jgi:hypothetical protein
MLNSDDIELTEQDKADLASLTENPPEFHTILEVWQTILDGAEKSSREQVGPGYAARVTAQFPQVQVQQMNTYRDMYFAKIADMKAILDAEIATDKKALSYDNKTDDGVENATHYKNILLQWQQQFVQWEQNFDVEHAALDLGTMSEVHTFFFSQEGLVSYLGEIDFEYTEDDQLLVQDALREMREAS